MRRQIRRNYVANHDKECLGFISSYFSGHDRKCLIIGGAGFDPRAVYFANILKETLSTELIGIFIKEERPEPSADLISNANSNQLAITKLFVNCEILNVEIFSKDNAVVGGRKIIETIKNNLNLDGVTDVIVDFSALSIGISFPLTKYLYSLAKGGKVKNLHLVVAANPEIDHLIIAEPNDRISEVHGFQLGNLQGQVEKARLWLPQLSIKSKESLKKLHQRINPHDTCPILPFPSKNPRKGDLIVADFIDELEGAWEVDPRNYVYADESNPLDIYRTILRIDDERTPVFKDLDGSTIILSPLGSKVLAIGALMASLEREFPVVYVEALNYMVDWGKINVLNVNKQYAHVWLHGEAYL